MEPGQLFFRSDKKIIHAIAGCDTTSRLFGIGKSIPLKKMDNEHFRQQAAVFCETELSSNDAVTEAGEKAVVCLYGGKPCERLIDVRSRKFREKVLTSASAVEVNIAINTISCIISFFESVLTSLHLDGCWG